MCHSTFIKNKKTKVVRIINEQVVPFVLHVGVSYRSALQHRGAGRDVSFTEHFFGFALLAALVSNAFTKNVLFPCQSSDPVHYAHSRQELQDFLRDTSIKALSLAFLMSAAPVFFIMSGVDEKMRLWLRILLSFIVGTSIGCWFTYLFEPSPPIWDFMALAFFYVYASIVVKMLSVFSYTRIPRKFGMDRFKLIFMDYFLCNFVGGLAVGSNCLENYSSGVLTSFFIVFNKIPHDMYEFSAPSYNSWPKVTISYLVKLIFFRITDDETSKIFRS